LTSRHRKRDALRVHSISSNRIFQKRKHSG